MREHIFRGRDKYGRWWYGDLVQMTEKVRAVETDKTYIKSINYDIDEYGENCQNISKMEVDPETVGEYVGICDKKARSIYEGDIVKWTCYKGETNEIARIGKVLWDEEMCRFSLTEAGGSFYWNISTNRDREYEVIGNIFDNPELLGGSKNVD